MNIILFKTESTCNKQTFLKQVYYAVEIVPLSTVHINDSASHGLARVVTQAHTAETTTIKYMDINRETFKKF